MADGFTISPFEFFVLRTQTRFPFRYGIASMCIGVGQGIALLVESSGASS